MTLQPGSLIHDRYRLEAEIGRGGMAVVYRARDEKLQRSVAVKVLSESGLGTAGRARLVHEAQSAAQLNHPNIVTVHDVGEVDGTPFIVMELVEGGSLHDHPPGSTVEIVHIARQVCTALEHAHAQGVVHRDLKPENVLLTADGTVKLTDFGLALSIASRATTEGVIAGTVFYLAPEQALGQPLDGRTDLYAVGVMLYELAAGRLPFTAEDPLAVISQHLYTPVVPPSTHSDAIPAELEALILALMAKRPEDRPASADEVRRKLEAIDLRPGVAGRPRPASLIERMTRGRIVGRESELHEARTLWQQAAAGSREILLISGEPGVGKTRMTRELAAQASVTGGTVLVGECYSEAGAPYAPVTQIVLQGLEGRSPDELALPEFVLADLISLAPPLRARFPAVPPNPPDDALAERQRLADSLILYLVALARRSPVLLVLEDAHWADGATLTMLRHVARAHDPSLRLLMVLTYREIELDEARALNEVLMDLTREHLARRIKLTRLTREQTGEMLGVLFQEESTAEFLEAIYRETEGNPFFIEEVCKALIEQDILTREAGRWHRPNMADVHVPQSVRVAIQGRLAKMPDGAQELLRRAAIIGREFEYEILKQVCDLDEDPLIEALEVAERAQLVEEVHRPSQPRPASPTFTFVHALIPHTLSESVSGLRRQRIHRRIAEALERLAADRLDGQALRIGRHYAAGGEWDRAADFFLRAGNQASRVYAYPEAIEAYEEALAIYRERKETEREARLLLKLGQLYHSSLDFTRAQTAYRDGFALWQVAGQAAGSRPAPAAGPLKWANSIPRSLDPVQASYTDELLVIDQLLSGLVERTPEMDIVPDLARSWEILEDGLTYVFHLREDARWNDGAAVSARDFEFAWKRILNPANDSPNAPLLYDIRGARRYHRGDANAPDDIGVRAVDARTLRVELESPSGYFLHLLAMPTLFAVPAHLLEVEGPEWMRPGNTVSCGPFLVDEWLPDERIVLVRNPGYSGRFRGNLERVEILLLSEWTPNLYLELYEADRVMVSAVPPERVAEIRLQYPDRYHTEPIAGLWWIWFNHRRPPFDDVRVRRAFVHACDRETLAAVALRGSLLPGTGGLVPFGIPGHVPGIGLPYDLEKARSLLAEAGFPEGRGFPEVPVVIPAPMRDTPPVAFVHSAWAALGVPLREDFLPVADVERRAREDPPMVRVGGWLADYPDPDNFLRVAFSATGDTLWNQEYHELVLAAARSTHPPTRAVLYERADRLLIQDAVAMPLLYSQYHFLTKPQVVEYPVSPVRAWFWKDVVLE